MILTRQLVQATIRTKTATLCAADETGLVVSVSGTGIQPLLTAVEQKRGPRYHELCWGDWMIGKAAALLLLLLHPQEVFGAFMSVDAQAVLDLARVPYSCDYAIPSVLNRNGTGPCPMEMAVHGVEDPSAALEALKQVLGHVQSSMV